MGSGESHEEESNEVDISTLVGGGNPEGFHVFTGNLQLIYMMWHLNPILLMSGARQLSGITCRTWTFLRFCTNYDVSIFMIPFLQIQNSSFSLIQILIIISNVSKQLSHSTKYFSNPFFNDPEWRSKVKREISDRESEKFFAFSTRFWLVSPEISRFCLKFFTVNFYLFCYSKQVNLMQKTPFET